VLRAGDHHDVRDARADQLVDAMHNHRLAPDGQQMLVGHARERKQPRAGAAGENDALDRTRP